MTLTEERDGFIITVTKLYFDLWSFVVTKGGTLFLTDMVKADYPDDAIEMAYHAALESV